MRVSMNFLSQDGRKREGGALALPTPVLNMVIHEVSLLKPKVALQLRNPGLLNHN